MKESGYEEKEVLGTYYYVNHGTDISSKVHKYESIILKRVVSSRTVKAEHWAVILWRKELHM